MMAVCLRLKIIRVCTFLALFRELAHFTHLFPRLKTKRQSQFSIDRLRTSGFHPVAGAQMNTSPCLLILSCFLLTSICTGVSWEVWKFVRGGVQSDTFIKCFSKCISPLSHPPPSPTPTHRDYSRPLHSHHTTPHRTLHPPFIHPHYSVALRGCWAPESINTSTDLIREKPRESRAGGAERNWTSRWGNSFLNYSFSMYV